MNKTQIELRVLRAIEYLRNGVQPEDDFLEAKGDWPEPDRCVRQLAASANRARGELVLYVIGLESSGAIGQRSGIDLADWWAQVESRFEGGVAPDLDANFHVPDPEDSSKDVVVLAFGTDRAPYVITTLPDGPRPDFDIPLRVGTRTRSARRAELLRLLEPQAALPTLTLLDVTQVIQHYTPTNTEVELLAHVSLGLFVEPVSATPLLMPAHTVRGEMASGEHRFPLAYRGSADRMLFMRGGDSATPPPQYAPYVRADGIVATGPGRVALRFETHIESVEMWSELAAATVWDLTFSFGVAGGTRTAHANARVELDAEQPEGWGAAGRNLRWSHSATAWDRELEPE